MKFLNIRSRPRAKCSNDDNYALPQQAHGLKSSNPQFRPNPTAEFPGVLLEELLSYCCPRDDNYSSCEDSMVDGGCMLCNLKDLSQCALVNRQWSEAVQNVLYHHIRIDAVHYCDRENELVMKRKRRSFNNRDRSRPSPPQERLQLLARTVRENGMLADKVEYLKTPYMTREGSIADLARTISFLPNLLYVDLPDGVHKDDPLCDVLKQELQSRCSKIRHMKYDAGSEGSFQMLAHSTLWPELEALELSNLAVEPNTAVGVFVSLTALRDVKLAKTPLLDDSIFALASSVDVSLPPLMVLDLQDVPKITVRGLVTYLSRPGPRNSLTSLTLINTGVSAPDLHHILSAAPNLINLHSALTVSRPISTTQIPPLTSQSLQTFHYEIANADGSPNRSASPSDSYYTYLSSSILSGALPSLTHLYALAGIPQDLLQPASNPLFSAKRPGTIPAPLSSGLKRPLRLFTKSISELEWNLTLISPPSPVHHRGSTIMLGPESLRHAIPLSPQYRKQGRQSVIAGNGFGGFLAVPSLGLAPDSPESKTQRNDSDAWMG